MNHRKDDIITSDGPGDGYTQRITRSTNDGRETEVTYYDSGGRQVPGPAAKSVAAPGTVTDLTKGPIHPLKPVVADKP
jgi:hypothetical protein